jgi:hypothetical protein
MLETSEEKNPNQSKQENYEVDMYSHEKDQTGQIGGPLPNIGGASKEPGAITHKLDLEFFIDGNVDMMTVQCVREEGLASQKKVGLVGGLGLEVGSSLGVQPY